MPRRVQDIIPVNRRSIRDIPTHKDIYLDESEEIITINRVDKHAEKNKKKFEEEEEVVEKQVVEKPKKRKKRHVFPWAIIIIGVVVLLAGIGFFGSGHFARATFTLVPRVIPVKVTGAYIIPNASSGSFGYELMTVTGTASTSVPATQGSYSETKAQGSVTVYNAYSTQSQKLVAGTRLVSGSGLIYRLTSSIVVPGYTKSGTAVIPGSIKTSVVAEKAGIDYNISRSDTISDFKFIAYKGTAKYSGFYARLATDISGGFSGTRTIVAPTILASTTSIIQKNLSLDLQHKLMNSIPDGYIMYPDSYVTVFDKSNVKLVSTSSPSVANMSIDGTGYGIMFKKVDLARFLAGASSTNIFGQLGYTVPDIDDLSFTMTNKKDFSPIKKGNVTARISGTFDLVGAVPVETIKQAMIGVSLSQTQGILKKYVSVIDLNKSMAEINPPWVTTVPNDKNRLSVIIKNP